MGENSHRSWDTTLKVIGAIIALASFFWGMHEFQAKQEAARRELFEQGLWQDQLEVYRRVTNAVGAVAVSAGGERFEEAVSEFEQVYWGEAIFLEDDNVAEAMVAFAAELRDYSKGRRPVVGPSAEERLKLRAERVAVACRESSFRSLNELRGSDSNDK